MADATRPNVLLIHCHDLGRHLGCYGRDVATPNVDALAADGVRFAEYFATAPQCSPSRASIVTGKFPHRVGMLGLTNLGWDLPAGERTLPEYLGEAGYDTRLFGLQHVTSRPAELGYDEIWAESRRADDVSAAAASFLRDAPVEPFLATVGFFEPHRLGREGGWGYGPDEYDGDDPDAVDPLPWLPDRPGIREDHAALHGMIRAVDDAVGRIDDALADAGLRDDTLVVFTTDHGIAMPRAKGTCYDTGLGTALVMRYPGAFEAGATVDGLLSNVDLLPTLLDLAGVDAPDDLDGRSFLPALVGGPYEPRDRVFAGMALHDKYCPMRCVRTARFKYVRNFGELPPVYLPSDIRHGKAGGAVHRECYVGTRPGEELYDLDADPVEEENLVDDPGCADVLDSLRAAVDDWMERTDDPLLEGDVPLPDIHVEELRTPWG